MTSAASFLSPLPYFQGLGAGRIEEIARAASEVSFSRGEVLFLEGEPCRGLYVVKSGMVRIYKSSPAGREQVLRITRAGESFNDASLFDGGPNPASALALEDTSVYIIPREKVLSVFEDCPPALATLRMMAAQLRHLTTMIEGLSFQSVVGRLAKLLLELAVSEGGTVPVKRLTQDEMAAMVGSVRDVVGRALKQLERAGAIRIERNRLLVISPGKLKAMM